MLKITAKGLHFLAEFYHNLVLSSCSAGSKLIDVFQFLIVNEFSPYICAYMKPQILLASLTLLPTLMFGQVTIKDAENFSVGTRLKFQQCDATSIDPGFTGPKQTWDFSSLKPMQGKTTEEMVKPEKTPYAAQFPKANQVEKYSDGRYVFADIEKNQSYLVGFVSANGMVIEYPKPVVFAKRPISFGGTNSYPFTDKYTVNKLDFTGSGMVTIAADGYGTLILPNGKFKKALRVKITQKQKDVCAQYKSTTEMTIVTYAWFDEDHKSALLKISTTTSPSYNSKSVEYLLNEEDK